MSKAIRNSPNVQERNDWRASENWKNSVTAALSFVGSKTTDVANINAQTKATFTITVTGAREFMTVQVAVPAAFNASLIPWGYVSAADTVTVVIANPTAGAIDPASGTYHVRVMP